MPFSASLTPTENIQKIDFGTFSQSISSFLDLSVFKNLIEVTIRNPNLITFIDGFAGNSVDLTNPSGQAILFISGQSADGTINQKIIGIGSLRKIGTGKLSLKGINTYSGNTEITDGVLEIQTGVLGNGNYSGAISNATQFSIITPTQQTLSGIISGIGTLTSGGDVVLTNNNTYTGATIVLSAAKLTISRQTSGQLTSSSFTNAGTIVFTGSNNIIVASPISGSGQIDKSGTSTVAFNATNTNTGIVNILSGTLQFEKIASLYNGQSASWTKDKIIVNSNGIFAINVGGTGEFASSDITSLLLLASSISNNGFKAGSFFGFNTTNAAGGTFTLSNIIADSTGTGSGSIGIAKFGSNILVISGTNTFTGQVLIHGGTVSVSNFNFDNVPGPFGAGTLPIKAGINSLSKILYTGTATTTDKKILIDQFGCELETAVALTLTGVISGTGTFNKLGSGTLQLDGANTFSGAINVNAGVLRATNSLSFGSSSSQLTILSGTAFNLGNNIVISRPITINSFGPDNSGAIKNLSGSNEISGTITLNSTARIGCESGTLVLSNNINPSGNLLTFVSNSSGSIVSSGIISGTGGVVVNMVLGQCSIFGANTFINGFHVFSGTTNVNSIKNFSTPSSLGADSSNPVQFGGFGTTGTLNYQGSGDTSNRTIRVGINAATPAATELSNGTGTIIFSAAIFNIQTNATTGVGAGRTLTLGGSSDGQISGTIRDNLVTSPATGTAFISLVKSGTGKWTLAGANTYSGTTTINAGYLIVANASALGTIATATTVNSGASLQVSGGITLVAEPLTISGDGAAFDGAIANLSGTNSMSGAITMAANARIHSIAGSLTISGAISGATRTLTLGGAGTLTLSGIITLTTGGIICAGTGTIILSAANSYTGATAINSGAVRISNASALGTAGTITAATNASLEISGAITFARAVTISGIGATSEGSLMNRSGNNTFSGAITLGADSTIGSSAGIFTISGTITGATRNLIFTTAAGAEIVASNQIALTTGTLQKTGSGTLTLSGTTSTYTGTTSVLQGILRITSFSSFGTSSEVIVNDGATLQIQPTVAGTFSKLTTISGNGVSSQGALNNTALNNTIGSGVLKVGGSAVNRIASAAGLTLTINGITRNDSLLGVWPAPLAFDGAGTITLSGAISTAGPSNASTLTKVGTGTLNLGNHAHNYDGSTTISAGTLTRSVVSGTTTATGSFTAGTTLNVTFTGPVPAVGSTWKFFPADTTNTYSAVALTGATGRTGTYNKTTSTLTIS